MVQPVFYLSNSTYLSSQFWGQNQIWLLPERHIYVINSTKVLWLGWGSGKIFCSRSKGIINVFFSSKHYWLKTEWKHYHLHFKDWKEWVFSFRQASFSSNGGEKMLLLKFTSSNFCQTRSDSLMVPGIFTVTICCDGKCLRFETEIIPLINTGSASDLNVKPCLKVPSLLIRH